MRNFLSRLWSKGSIFRYTTPCNLLKVNWRFGGTYRLYLLGWRISQAINQQLVTCFHAGSLLGVFFKPEAGGDMFLRNVGWLTLDYTVYIPDNRYLHNHSCQTLKSYKDYSLCDVMSCSFVNGYQCFEEICWFHLPPWRCRQQVPPKCKQISITLHSVMTQETTIWSICNATLNSASLFCTA
jgi:hypothetical protein